MNDGAQETDATQARVVKRMTWENAITNTYHNKTRVAGEGISVHNILQL